MPALSFSNIVVTVPDIKGPKRFLPNFMNRNAPRKEVLHNVSATFPSRGLVAIMGPSGSGKTTLLSAISNRMAIGGGQQIQCSGIVRIDGQQVPPSFFYSKSVAFVPQDTCLFSELTPRESIRFATSCLLPSLTPELREKRVSQTLNELSLNKCADGQIGNEMFRGVSGGERKRYLVHMRVHNSFAILIVSMSLSTIPLLLIFSLSRNFPPHPIVTLHRVSIGVSIVAQPSVLFLDEPTTGLDCTFHTQLRMHSA